MNIVPVNQNNFSSALHLLKQNDLPTEDITDTTKLFVMELGNDIIGTIGIEFHNSEALLRSLSVDADKRTKGLGQQLVLFIEDYAGENGAKSMWLLTTTAEAFFSKRNYTKIERDIVPSSIRSSSEFSSVCPSTATVMVKKLQSS